MEKEKKYYGGRPHTGRDNPITIKLSQEAIDMLKGQNRSAIIDMLIRGEVARLKCHKCGEIITLKTEEL